MSEEVANAEIVSRAFVKQYYHTLNEAPQFLDMFYNDSCLFNRLYPATQVKKTVWTKDEVKDEFLAVRFEDFTAEIETSLGLPYPMENGHVIVFVNGYLTSKKNSVRNKFTQTFLLAQQDNGFCVLNDIFRLKKEQTQTCLVTETQSRSRSRSRSEPQPVASSHELSATERSDSMSGRVPSKGEDDDDEWFMGFNFRALDLCDPGSVLGWVSRFRDWF